MGTTAMIHNIKRLQAVIDELELDRMAIRLAHTAPTGWTSRERLVDDLDEIDDQLHTFLDELDEVRDEVKRFLATDLQNIFQGLQ